MNLNLMMRLLVCSKSALLNCGASLGGEEQHANELSTATKKADGDNVLLGLSEWFVVAALAFVVCAPQKITISARRIAIAAKGYL